MTGRLEKPPHAAGSSDAATLTGAEMKVDGRIWMFTLGLAWAAMLFVSPVAGEDFASQRESLDLEYRQALEGLADEVAAAGDAELATSLRQWPIPRDPRRLYVFLPDSLPLAQQPGGSSAEETEWGKRFWELRRQQASELFELARARVAEGDGSLAMLLLHEVLHENPDHTEARRILGYRREDDEWTLGRKSFSSSTIYRPHDQFDWRPGEHHRVLTDHFVISTSHSLEQGEAIGRVLEPFYMVWKQVFYDFWSDARILERRFDSDRRAPRSSLGRGSRKFNVILFRDYQEYIDKLSPFLPGVASTYGYYAPQREEAFFFAGDASAERTWLHETTHQMFQESIRSEDDVAIGNGIWALEGIATFMESMQRHRGYATLGGFDASWLQYARFRAMSQKFYVPLEELVQISREALQGSEISPKLYSQSAGLSHFLMTGGNDHYRQSFVAYLESLYRPGRHRPDALFEIAQLEPTQLDREYAEFLPVDRNEVANYWLQPAQAEELVLGFSDVDDESLEKLDQATRLKWLDLTATKITDETLLRLAECQNLSQLFIGGTRVTDRGLKALQDSTSLLELDLVGLRITSDGVQALRELPRLQSLRLNGTAVDDRVLAILRDMQALRSLDLRSTRVSIEGIKQLQAARPEIQIQFDDPEADE